MRKLSYVILLLMFGLAACGPLTPPTSSSTEPVQAQPGTPTALTAATVMNVSSGPAECRLVARTEPNPTIEAILPKVAEKDWSKGLENASITFTEYSDFQ